MPFINVGENDGFGVWRPPKSQITSHFFLSNQMYGGGSVFDSLVKDTVIVLTRRSRDFVDVELGLS